LIDPRLYSVKVDWGHINRETAVFVSCRSSNYLHAI
jgi:hypothetical protein